MAPPKKSAATKQSTTATKSTKSKQTNKRVSFTDTSADAGSDVDVTDTDYALPDDSKLKKPKSTGFDMITDTMNAQGPTVNILHLPVDGTLHTIYADMTPKVDTVGKLLSGSATFLGELPTLDAIVIIRRDQTLTSLPVNKHTLPAPFTQGYEHITKNGKSTFKPVRGDIVIVRMDNNAVPVDLSQQEYNDYCSTATESTTQPKAKKAKTSASTKSTAKTSSNKAKTASAKPTTANKKSPAKSATKKSITSKPVKRTTTNATAKITKTSSKPAAASKKAAIKRKRSA